MLIELRSVQLNQQGKEPEPVVCTAAKPELGAADYAARLTQTNMAPYYASRKLSWQPEMFAQSWLTYDNYEIYYDKRRVGVLRFSYLEDTTCIRDLQIEPAFHGKGIGTECLRFACRHAREKQHNWLALRVFSENPARNLYQRFGFRTQPMTPASSSGDRAVTPLDLLEMRLNLRLADRE